MTKRPKPPKRIADLVGKRVEYRAHHSQKVVYGTVEMPPFIGSGMKSERRSSKKSFVPEDFWCVAVTDEGGYTHLVPAKWVRARRNRKVRV